MDGAAFPPPALTVPQKLHDPRQTNGKLPLSGKRIGLYKVWFEDAASEVVAACTAAVRLLEAQGCEVRPETWPALPPDRLGLVLPLHVFIPFGEE
jgi:Asp-tRNA(Asn)/Glu-tRNA(Gln) amidotransferase A subunit family amidase